LADSKSFDENAGTNKLANVLSERMKREGESSLCLDFGEIQANGSLLTNTFPVSIPKGQYTICRHVGGLSFTISGGGHPGHEEQTKTHNTGAHTHTVAPPVIKAGDRVLVAWVQSEAVVIDVIVSS
jgi:hypothetical protein